MGNIEIKTKGLGIILLLIVAACAPITLGENQPTDDDNLALGVLEFSPKSHNFGNMTEGKINTTTFEIWRAGGCCSLEYALECNCSWVKVFPTSGTSHGEHDIITVDVTTLGLDPGHHSRDINITSNGGNGVFTVELTIIITDWPDLVSYGKLNWWDVGQGSVVDGIFYIKNEGDPGSLLDWSIESYPEWGNWSFSVKNGDNLKPEDDSVTVQTSVVVPSIKNNNFSGLITIVNRHDENDFCHVNVSLSTPRITIRNMPFFKFLNHQPCLCSILQYLLKL